MTINLTGIVDGVYTMTNAYVPDYVRISFTQLWLETHNLRVETGRWVQTSRDRRICNLCDTGEVQDEEHALLDVPANTQAVRDTNGNSCRNFQDLLCDTDNTKVCIICL